MQTTTNAVSVPMETSGLSTSIGSSPARTAAKMPVMIEPRHGVLKRGWMWLNTSKNSPSLAMA